MNDSVLFSSKSIDWSTPQELFDALDKRFQFTLDVCASDKNAKVKRYFTRELDGLGQSWGGERCWMNPPYGREIGKRNMARWSSGFSLPAPKHDGGRNT